VAVTLIEAAALIVVAPRLSVARDRVFGCVAGGSHDVAMRSSARREEHGHDNRRNQRDTKPTRQARPPLQPHPVDACAAGGGGFSTGSRSSIGKKKARVSEAFS
jgi:hypothetical protein